MYSITYSRRSRLCGTFAIPVTYLRGLANPIAGAVVASSDLIGYVSGT